MEQNTDMDDYDKLKYLGGVGGLFQKLTLIDMSSRVAHLFPANFLLKVLIIGGLQVQFKGKNN